MVRISPRVAREVEGPSKLAVQCVATDARAYGWIHRTDFGDVDPKGEPVTENTTVVLANMRPGDYQAEFWDTHEGRRISVVIPAVEGGEEADVTIAVPAFARDIAFKLKHVDVITSE